MDAIAISTLLTGLFLFVMGRLHLGRWVRFIPYPVMGGFLAGTGWEITRSSFKVMAGIPLEWTTLPHLMQTHVFLHWLPGFILAIVLITATQHFQNAIVLPILLLGAVISFDLIWKLISLFIPLTPDGWFLASFSNDQLWYPISSSMLSQVNWTVLFNQSGLMIALMMVVVITILLNATSTELATQRDSNLDKELQTNGIANLAIGVSGGMVGYLSFNRTSLNHRAGASSPLAGLTASALCATVFLVGSAFLACIPRAVLGGILLMIGLKLMVEWLIHSWLKFPRHEYALILVILVTIAVWGFIQGIGVGIIVACAMFAVSYSRHQVIRHGFTGATRPSNVQRSFPEQRILRQRGDQIYIVLLQGYIFFGTANALLEQIRERLVDPDLPIIHFLILDFRLVSGLDSSVVLSFIKMRQLAEKHAISLVFTHLQPTILLQLYQGGCIQPNDNCIQLFPELDRGIEWCEDRILETLSLRRRRSLPLALQLNEFFDDLTLVPHFMSYLEHIQVPVNHILFQQGGCCDALYFIESGQVTVFLQLDNGQTRRLQTLGAGAIVGETTLYLGTPHKMSAIIDQPSKLYRLTTLHLKQMRQESPQVAAAFQDFIIRLLSDRLIYAYEEIEELL
ncbi:MAG: cyclic nucleotide-binding domain-containing protein [Cyanobacteria bacterium CRU_2_1]|nr:cyclic nucleotide-binding domain-containing protein [Cyanobacteria bacterium CRU_2_1]